MVRTGPGLEPEVSGREGAGPQHVSGQRLGGGLSLGWTLDRYWIEVEPVFMAGSETKPW